MWIYLIITLVLLIFTYFKIQADSIKQRIESAGLSIPYFGNTTFTMYSNMLFGISFFEFTLKQYNKVKQSGHKLALYTHLGSTTLEVRDPVILKHILIKDFEYFTERRSFTPSKSFLMNKMLSVMKGDSWRALRGKLSPAFTSKKLRRLFTRLDQSGKELMKFLESEIQRSPGGEINIMTTFPKFTIDIIASAVCGIDARVYEGSTPSQFQEMGDKVLLAFSSVKTSAKLLLASILPARIIDAIGISMIDKEIRDFFGNAIRYSMENRAGKDEGRDDFLQLMLEARAGMLKLEEYDEMEVYERDAQLGDTSNIVLNSSLLDDEGIVSNCVQFIFAGLDSMNSHLIFIAYELALNQDVQNKLRDEIVKTLNSTDDGKLTYEVIGGLVYLDMVINEALRRWSPAVQVNRVCVKNYKVPGTEFVLKKGEAINVSVYGMHMDEDNYPNPEIFDPERFAPENKSSINSYTFIPFGQGPRNCIGMRFAQIETKVAIAQLVKNFKIEPSKRTEIPLKLAGSFVLKPKNDIFLSLKKLN